MELNRSQLGTVPLRALLPQPETSASGKLDGIQLDPRVIAAHAYAAGPKWRDAHVLSMAVMVCLSESQGWTEAHCDNFRDHPDGTRKLLSRDVGCWQINIPANLVGTSFEKHLQDPRSNAKAAYALYDRRGWQPWVAFNTGVCYFDAYLQRGVLGVMNFLASGRVEEARNNGHLQETSVPIFLTKQLPYTKKKKERK